MPTRLIPQIARLLFREPPGGPIDLHFYQQLIHAWFDGVPIYAEMRYAVHPPALFLLLWPIFGGLADNPTRWLFAGLTAMSLVGLAILVLRAVRPATTGERFFFSGLILTCYPTAISIGVGQATLPIVLAALGGVLLLMRSPPSLGRDVAASALFLFSLAKPNLSAPFLAVSFLARGPSRPLILVVVGYVVMTAASIALHGTGMGDLGELVFAWLHRSGRALSASGYGNVQSWMGALGLRSGALPVSVLVFALHGFWSWHHRKADPWISIGVAAIVTRLWAYHGVYDDILLLLPLVALYRLFREAPPHTIHGNRAGFLFGLGSLGLLAPVTPMLAHAEAVWVGVWILQLGFLIQQAGSPAIEKGRGPHGAPS